MPGAARVQGGRSLHPGEGVSIQNDWSRVGHRVSLSTKPEALALALGRVWIRSNPSDALGVQAKGKLPCWR